MKQRRIGLALKHLRSNAIAYVALFAAIGGGTATAAKLKLPRNSVGPKQVKANAIDSTKVRDGSLKPEDLAAGTIPGAATANEVVERTVTDTPSNSSDVLVASPPGLGEVRAFCNTGAAGGAVILSYSNDTNVPIHLIQSSDYDNDVPDQRNFESETVPANTPNAGSFTNHAVSQRHEIELISAEASPRAATVIVSTQSGGGICRFHSITLGG